MDTRAVPGMSGSADVPDGAATVVELPLEDRAIPGPATRRFAFDPMSSPVLAVALAWDAADPRR